MSGFLKCILEFLDTTNVIIRTSLLFFLWVSHESSSSSGFAVNDLLHHFVVNNSTSVLVSIDQ